MADVNYASYMYNSVTKGRVNTFTFTIDDLAG